MPRGIALALCTAHLMEAAVRQLSKELLTRLGRAVLAAMLRAGCVALGSFVSARGGGGNVFAVSARAQSPG
jgi:hypothetical protein